MKIWINPLHSPPSAHNFLEYLPGAIQEAKVDDSAIIPEGADVQLHWNNTLPAGPPPSFHFITDIDATAFPHKSWWPWAKPQTVQFGQVLTGSAGIFVSHQLLAEALREHYPVTSPLHVVGYGLPDQTRELRPADSVTRRITKEVYGRDKSFFLAPSTGHLTDNLERLIQAYGLFRQRCPEAVVLLINGLEKDQPKSVQKAVKTSGFRKDISFLGRLSEAEYWKIYSSARAILYPSLSTRFPLDILKAWQAQVPVLAGDNDVLGGGGAQVQCLDYKSIAEGMLALATTPFLASGLVDNGKRRLEQFTWERVAGRVADVLKQQIQP